MKRMFIVMAVSTVQPKDTSVMTQRGWRRVDENTAPAQAFTSDGACRVRDSAKENTLNKNYTYHIVEVTT